MAKKGALPDRAALIKEIAELKAEQKFSRHGQNISGVVSVSKELIKYGAIAAIFYFIYLSIAVLAGQTTFASIGITILGNVTLSQSVAWIFGASGMIYGVNERRLRKKTVAKFQPRITELEKLIDAGRSSSTLTLKGDTNPEDL